jgi:hypothetical protein
VPFPTDNACIEAAEARLGARLPSSFRQHLLNNNGGEVDVLGLNWELSPVQDASDVERMRDTSIDVLHETTAARQWRGFPSKAVAVGSDGCGNYLIFLPSETDAAQLEERLYVWWHEGSEVELVSESFKEGISAG